MADEWQCQASRNTCAHVYSKVHWHVFVDRTICICIMLWDACHLHVRNCFVVNKEMQNKTVHISQKLSKIFAKMALVKGEIKPLQHPYNSWATTQQWISAKKDIIQLLNCQAGTADLDWWLITQLLDSDKKLLCVKHPVIQRCTGSHKAVCFLFLISQTSD